MTLGGASACELFVDTSGLSTRQDAPDAPLPDAPSGDASASDAGVKSFCSMHPDASFCDDFDDPPLGARWSSTTAMPHLSLDPKAFTSPPNGLRVDLDMLLVPHLTKDLPAGQEIHVEADLRVDTSEAGGDVDLIDLYLSPPPAGTSRYYVALVRYLGRWVIETSFNDSDNVRSPIDATFTSFQHFELDVDLIAGSARVAIDGAGALDQPIMPATSKGAQLRVGTPYADASTPWQVHFDNVLVTTR
jgi:hypothetical protein